MAMQKIVRSMDRPVERFRSTPGRRAKNGSPQGLPLHRLNICFYSRISPSRDRCEEKDVAPELTRRRVLAVMGSLVPAVAAFAYPDRPIKLVVALAPGGPADTAARVFAPYFAEQIGQSIVIENRTGASSVVGTESVVRAPPDGYTLLFGSSSSFAVNPAVMRNLRFDVRHDLKLVGLVSYTPHVLVVRAPLAANTLAELIALAKAQPGKLTYASSGAGGAIHLASELFKREAGVDIVHVPYRGGGPAVLGLLTGDVDI